MVRAVRYWALFLPAIVLGLHIADRPELVVNADQLLPALFTWDLLHHQDVWRNFQHSRVLSLVPDLLVYGALQALTENWRIAYTAWIVLVVCALVGLSGWIVARIAHVDAAIGTAASFCLIALGIGGSLAIRDATGAAGMSGHWMAWSIVMPLNHGGQFLLALPAALLAAAMARRPRLLGLAGLFGIAAAATLSDLLFVGEFLLPVSLAVLAGLTAGTLARWAALLVLASVWAGGALGWLAAGALHHQPTPFPTLASLPGRLAMFAIDIGARPALIGLLDAVLIVLAIDVWRRGMRGWLDGFWPVFAASSMLGTLAITALLYQDTQSFRYAMACLWWLAILLAAGLARKYAARPGWLYGAVAGLSGLLLLGFPSSGWREPALLRWQNPLAGCLHAAGLQAGLAEFWAANPIAAASDWDLQVEQLFPDGTPRIWGSDPRGFSHASHDWSRPPTFQFIVMTGLVEADIRVRFGPADRVLDCAGAAVWVYDDPARLRHGLGALAEQYAPEQ